MDVANREKKVYRLMVVVENIASVIFFTTE